MNSAQFIVAVDIGNSRMKLGRFDHVSQCAGASLPEPVESATLSPPDGSSGLDVERLADWLAEFIAPGTPIVVGSVSRSGTQLLRDFLRDYAGGQWDHFRLLGSGDFAIDNRTDQPERVGVDRLAAAVAANAVRRENTPAIVIDFGTAITVDLLGSDGGFEGGAILPGVATSAEALHAKTDALPIVRPPLEGKSPPAVGKNTTAAIQSGLYWGAVGAVRELIARQRDGLVAPPQVLVTGSTTPDMARLLGSPDYTVRYIPHLVLAGLAMSAG